MTSEELLTAVAVHKPVFAKILKEQGDQTLINYYNTHRHQPANLPEHRQEELLTVISELAERLLGPEVARSVAQQLRNNYLVSTAGHHDTLTQPLFINHVLTQAYANTGTTAKNVIILSCGGISLNNSSFPRGFLLHDNQGREERLHLLSLKNHHHPVYGRAGFGASALRTIFDELAESSLSPAQRGHLKTLIELAYGNPETLGLPLLSDQLTRGVFTFWKQVPGLATTNVVSLEQETIVGTLLQKFHLSQSTVIHALLFDEKTRTSFLNHFDGITGAFNSRMNKGTQLFWGITPKTRVALQISGNALVSPQHKLRIPLTPEAINQALTDKTLMPSMALTYIVLSFYYGLSCAGGFSQVNYLTDMKKAYQKILADISGYESEAGHLQTLSTDFFACDFVLALLGMGKASVPATPFDLIIYGNRKTDRMLRKLANSLTLRQVVEPVLPELYKIITGEQPAVTPLPGHGVCALLSDKCYYCGNNPTPHLLARTNEYLDILNWPLNWLSRSWIGKLIEQLLDRLTPYLVQLACLLRIVRYNTDPKKVLNSRSEVIWEEAHRRGIPIRQLIFLGRPTDFYEASLLNNKKIIFESIPVPPKKQTDSIEWMDDKLKLKKRLIAANIPVARGGAFHRFESMRTAFQGLEKPVIVKPAQGSRGRHTTTFIYTEEHLKQAFDIGRQIAHRLVMEEHLVGSVYRGTVIDGKLLGVLRGDPPRITGDGKSTIAQLISIKNETRHEKVKEFKVTPLTETFLARSSYTLQSVLPAGVTIDLTEKVGLSYGGFTAEEIGITHPETKRILESAARVVDFPIIGFDFIIGDITKNPREQKWGIIEANSLPFIDLHAHPVEGQPINVAAHVWNWWV